MERYKSRTKKNQKGISRLSVIIIIIVIVIIASIVLGVVTGKQESNNIVGTNQNQTSKPTENENEPKNELIVPAGHDHDYNIALRTTEATCLEPAKSYLGCECGDETVVIDGPSLGHTWGQGQVTKVSTCQEEGEITYTCSVCEQTRNENLETSLHDFSVQTINDDFLKEEAGCTSLAVYYYKCANCDEKGENTFTYGETLGHSWDEGEVTEEATDSEDGERLFTCTVCEETRTEVIPALNQE